MKAASPPCSTRHVNSCEDGMRAGTHNDACGHEDEGDDAPDDTPARRGTSVPLGKHGGVRLVHLAEDEVVCNIKRGVKRAHRAHEELEASQFSAKRVRRRTDDEEAERCGVCDEPESHEESDGKEDGEHRAVGAESAFAANLDDEETHSQSRRPHHSVRRKPTPSANEAILEAFVLKPQKMRSPPMSEEPRYPAGRVMAAGTSLQKRSRGLRRNDSQIPPDILVTPPSRGSREMLLILAPVQHPVAACLREEV